jgi:REP element-mobilizing transposase RayT
MHAYLATVCRDLGVDFVQVGGVSDHVHIVTTLPRTLSKAQLVEQIKKTSSKWIKELNASYRGFFWQQGRLSLGKGEGEGEGFLGKLALVGRPRTPLTLILSPHQGERRTHDGARGYGVFSVSPSQFEALLQYINAQQEHHRTRTFQEKYRELLRRHGLDFDERYVWD